jgi:hypothetical protein
MTGDRGCWKIENETINTLKNQGYNFEHNYVHGHKNLSSIFCVLMLLAFFTDQIQQIAYDLFKDILIKVERKFQLCKDFLCPGQYNYIIL